LSKEFLEEVFSREGGEGKKILNKDIASAMPALA
jgi:hypothetical protein